MNEKGPKPGTIEHDIEEGLNHIRRLGAHKTMGYLPIDTLRSYFKSNVEREIERAKKSGYQYLIAKEAPIGDEGALYVYDEKNLQALLNAQKETLITCGWPTNAESFVARVSQKWVDESDPEVLQIIENAFGS